jgi:hypothetical protein
MDSYVKILLLSIEVIESSRPLIEHPEFLCSIIQEEFFSYLIHPLLLAKQSPHKYEHLIYCIVILFSRHI